MLNVRSSLHSWFQTFVSEPIHFRAKFSLPFLTHYLLSFKHSNITFLHSNMHLASPYTCINTHNTRALIHFISPLTLKTNMHLQTIMHIIKILNAYQLNAYIHLTIAHMHSTKIITCALPANQFTNLPKILIHLLLIIYIGDNLSSTIYVLDVQEHQCDATIKNYAMDQVRIWKIAWATSKIIFGRIPEDTVVRWGKMSCHPRYMAWKPYVSPSSWIYICKGIK
mgnify:CR=1 FL=1